MRIATGIAEPHRHQSDTRLVIKELAADAEPIAQPVAAAVVEGEPGLVHAGAGRLADDQQTGRGQTAHDGARAERQFRGAAGAGSDLGTESVERVSFHRAETRRQNRSKRYGELTSPKPPTRNS